ncbi:orotate phosphoribosyltransferase [Oceanibacterium hippocampi]|uniref:Orotate phosphoribosyltransferase n=1 Tax=Oceanibacterium hippocampi TaxID=745714 RepID=A0A1Y5TYN4_9PROT|nr:orotate phosphoribosyltransferase [Oceanibacterium hippocampi]SLN77076.1 Orotate phosphoribosyltransferase [Oceanibacterium hippocampi]
MTHEEVLSEFRDAGALLEGHFLLTSGRHSPLYLQCARVMMSPDRGGRLCRALAAMVRAELGDDAVDIVVAPAMGGVIVGYELARHLGLDSIFAERVEGRFALRRGFTLAPGARVLVVEDVVTTGKSSLECFDCIRAAGGEVVAEASLIDRSGGSAALGVPLISLARVEVPSYAPDEVPAALAATPAVKPGSRGLA